MRTKTNKNRGKEEAGDTGKLDSGAVLSQEALKPKTPGQPLRMASLEEKTWRGAALTVISETVATDCPRCSGPAREDERLSK